MKPNRLALYCLACLMSLAAACSLWNRPEAVDRDGEMEQFTSHGGYPRQDYAVSSTHETWLHDDIPIEVSILIPSAPGKLPVVVYLPGTGEDTEHGELWKRPWAQAGYVVVSIQPKEYGEALWSNHQLKPGDFKSVGRTVFSRHALENRAFQLAWALEKLAARVRSGNERYANIDLSRMVLAGYDLGAQTTMAFAGEKVDLALPKPLPVFSAAIIISPHVDPTWEKVARRYADIRMPLLLVSSEQDLDPARISTPQSRKFLWTDLPPGEKYLLWFERANHRLLSGTMSDSSYWFEIIGPIVHERRGKASGSGPGDYDGATGATSGSGRGWLHGGKTEFGTGRTAVQYDALGAATSRGGGGGGGDGRSRNSGTGDGGGRRRKNRDAENLKEEIAVQTSAARQMAIVVSVTTAFLDTIVKDSKEARAWLLEDSTDWLKEYAKWLHK